MNPLAVVLAGGKGTRLQRVLPGVPKPLAPVAGKHFLEWVLRYLREQGIERAVVSAGYLAEKVERAIGRYEIDGLQVSCVAEAAPLGTGGGCLNAMGRHKGDVLVLNGDSLVLTSLRPLMLAAEHMDGAVLGVKVKDASRYGTLQVKDSMLAGFEEKRPGAGLVNAGVYLFKAETLARFPRGESLSFEYDIYPALIADGARIAVARCEAPFLDIGTEESLKQAEAFVQKHMDWFS
jgi:D-glycero-alpha-D-manno-heptose 1-phosphate guanylyltransferase